MRAQKREIVAVAKAIWLRSIGFAVERTREPEVNDFEMWHFDVYFDFFEESLKREFEFLRST